MTVSKKQIEEAVRGLAADDDANWTGTGLPSVDAVSSALGERVSREDITAATGLDRTAAQNATATDAGAEMRRTRPVEGDPADYADDGGPTPDQLFEALDRIVTATSSPRYRRNQVLQQIRLLWSNEEKNARQAQDKMEGRIDRRAAKREERAERKAEEGEEAAA